MFEPRPVMRNGSRSSEVGELEWRSEIALSGGEVRPEASPVVVRALRELVERQLKKECPLDATLPALAQRIYVAAGDPKTSINALIDLAGQDPPLAGRLVLLANNSYYARQAKVSSVGAAVMRVGVAAIRNMVLVPFLKARLVRDPAAQAQWAHARLVAAIAPFVAALGLASPDTAQLAGLLHDAGEIILILEAQRLRPRFGDALEPAIEALHEEIGARVLEKWRLPTEICETARTHHRPNPASGEAAHRLASVVAIADALAVGHEPDKDVRVQAAMKVLQLPLKPLLALEKRLPAVAAEVGDGAAW